jgi:ankyrin repeat protein
MSVDLPDRASLEYLRKAAKERLRAMRLTNTGAKLTEAQLAIAREYGFSSWRALKAEVDRRQASPVAELFEACAAGDVATVRRLIERNAGLVAARNAEGGTPLHAAVPHPDIVRLLLERGADPNARDKGDNALPLHFAAGGGPIESVQTLIDAGSDVHGLGDAHELEVIGWATVFDEARRDVVDLLVRHGARHHIFSAVALGDLDLVRQVVARDARALDRRLSPTEGRQTALHYTIAPPDGLVGGRFRTGEHYRTLELLIELGADLEARDAKDRTPMELAMLRGDDRAIELLHAAGATLPQMRSAPHSVSLGESVQGMTPMISVANMDETIAWYQSIGFELERSHGDAGKLDWASLKLGVARVMLVPSPNVRNGASSGISLWFRTNRIDELYASLKSRQLEYARAKLAGEPTTGKELRFTQDLYTAFYGQREFCLRDPNGVDVNFYQPLE